MKSSRIRSIFILAVVAVSAISTLPAAAGAAASIHGTVVNGTTDSSSVEAEVSIIKPAAGMAPIRTLRSTNGEFTADGLDPGVYMARVSYQGVTYNETVQLDGDGRADVTVTVYDTTDSWDGVRVVVPHFTAARHDNHLVIERVYDVYNESKPPRTIAGEDARFRFPVPQDVHDFNGMYVQYGEVPVERQPVETDQAGVYSVDYPIRPGLTRVVMAYAVGYDSAAVTLSEKLQYDIESFTIFATDNEMQISSPTHRLVGGEGPHAGLSWTIEGLARGEELALSFRGGANQATSQAAQSTVTVVPDEAEGLSMLLMVILLLALVAFTGIALREPVVAGAEALHFEEYRDVLVARLAKLDDLHQTGAIPAAAYQAKRAEIKNRLASLMMRLGSKKGPASRSKARHGKKVDAR